MSPPEASCPASRHELASAARLRGVVTTPAGGLGVGVVGAGACRDDRERHRPMMPELRMRGKCGYQAVARDRHGRTGQGEASPDGGMAKEAFQEKRAWQEAWEAWPRQRAWQEVWQWAMARRMARSTARAAGVAHGKKQEQQAWQGAWREAWQKQEAWQEAWPKKHAKRTPWQEPCQRHGENVARRGDRARFSLSVELLPSAHGCCSLARNLVGPSRECVLHETAHLCHMHAVPE